MKVKQTFSINKELLHSVKIIAVQNAISYSALVEMAITEFIAKRSKVPE